MLDFSRIESVAARCLTVFKAIPVSTLQFLIIAAILAWLFLQLGRAVWWFAPDPVVTPIKLSSNTTVSTSPLAQQVEAVNLAKLQSWNWFGKADQKSLNKVPKVEPKKPAVDESSAVKTRLKLILRGVVATNNQDLAHAVIEASSKQHDYKVGDKIKISGNVKLAKVLPDHVILDNRGRLESLYLYIDNPKNKNKLGVRKTTTPKQPESNVVDHRNDPSITRLASQYRRQLLENPTSLADVIRVSPNQGPSGTLNGYRIRPGLHRKQFAQLGFKSGDVVTAINGIDLSNPTKALEVYQMMREASEASFSVKRGGNDLTFIVDLSE